jgi:L-lactate dehydrogenase complex protein LldF
VDINIPDMLLMLRRDLEKDQEAVWKIGLKSWSFGNTHPLLYEVGGKAASLATRTISKTMGEDKLNKLPYPLNGWTDYRDFPSFAEQSFHDWWRQNRRS